MLIACSTTKDPGQTTVDHVDLDRFMGNWYEVARYETSIQSECGAAKVNYKLEQRMHIEVLHACHDKESGKIIHAKGLGEIVDKKTNAKWKVSYIPIFKKWHVFSGSIWIVALDKEYQYAILGHPTHKHLWILSRSPDISTAKYDELVSIASWKGYKTKELIRVPTWK